METTREKTQQKYILGKYTPFRNTFRVLWLFLATREIGNEYKHLCACLMCSSMMAHWMTLSVWCVQWHFKSITRTWREEPLFAAIIYNPRCNILRPGQDAPFLCWVVHSSTCSEKNKNCIRAENSCIECMPAVEWMTTEQKDLRQKHTPRQNCVGNVGRGIPFSTRHPEISDGGV